MGNILPQKRSFSSQLKDKTCDSKEVYLYSRKIKHIFTNNIKGSFIDLTSDVQKFVKKRNRFYRILAMTLGSSIRSKKKINAIVSASKDRKLTSCLCMQFSNCGSVHGFRDKDMKKISIALKSQRNISTLFLNFCMDSNLTKESSKLLISAIRSMFLSGFGFAS